MASSRRPVRFEVHDDRAVPGIAGARRLALTLALAEPVPALLQLPRARPAPAAVLLHGYSSRKEQMADALGRTLLRHGIASLALDLPLHGERMGELDDRSFRQPLALVRQWRLALAEAAAAVRFLAVHEAVDATRIAMMGYSLGSFIAVLVAAAEPQVRAVVVAAGGDLPTHTPFATLARAVADPLRAVRRLAGRPLLVVHGRRDRTVRPDQAERLFAAASEPKTILWYDAGHWLPPRAIDDAAGWLEKVMRVPGRRTAGL